MKNIITKSLVLTFSLFTILALTSCDRPRVNEPGEGMGIQSEITDLEELNSLEVIGGDLEQQFEVEEIYAFEESPEGRPHREFGKRKSKKFKRELKKRFVKHIFDKMDLSREQLASVREFMKQNRDCSKEYFKEIRITTREIVIPFNDLRKSIIEQVKAGEMTKEEAKSEFQSMRADIKEKLHSSERLKELREALKKCREEFHENISSILTDEQLEIWLEFINR